MITNIPSQNHVQSPPVDSKPGRGGCLEQTPALFACKQPSSMNITVRTLAGDLPLSSLDPGMTVANVLQALVGAARQAGVEELPSRLVRRPAAPVPRVTSPGPSCTPQPHALRFAGVQGPSSDRRHAVGCGRERW